MMGAALRRELPRVLRETGYFRRTKFRWEGVAGHKEWLHFAVHAAGLDLLANFSLVDDVRRGARAGSEHARIVCLVRERAWTGDVDQYAPSEVSVHGGALDVRFGESFVRFEDERLRLRVKLKRRPIALDLALTPLTFPTQANNIEIDDCPPIHWLVVPRLRADGCVEIEGRRHELERALAYHDHNWGYFRWGKDFTWEWGYAAPERHEHPWTLVFVRLMDRAHHRDSMRVVVLWKGERQERLFQGDEIQVWHDGLLRPQRVFKLPRVMGLVSPGTVTDVPKRLEFRVRRGSDRIDGCFETKDVAQVVIPNDDDPGVTVIHEVSGEVTVEGRIDGDALSIQGPSIFEFLGE